MTINKIKAGFEERYRHFIYFLEDADKEISMLRELCFEAAKNEQLLANIRFCNDYFKIPPVRSFCANYKDKIGGILTQIDKKRLTDRQKRGIGAFWGAVFKGCLGYEKSDNKPVPLKHLDISTASYFYHDSDSENE
jgi:hypothetical protein